MSKLVWKKLSSPELIPSAITLRACDGRPSSPEGIFQNFLVELRGKNILIDIEFIDSPLDYNILFGHIYMYAVKNVACSMFLTMMFPHNRKIITIDQVSHYEPNHSSNIDNILPLFHTSSDTYPLMDMGPEIFKDPSFLGEYHGAPPLIHPSTQVCPPTSSNTCITDIHYVTTSINELMGFLCSLCDSLDHFTYQFHTIIEYRCHQMAFIQDLPNTALPVIQVIPPIPSPDTDPTNSPKPESLPIPPWFMDRLSEDFPPNPPNSLVHFLE
jgi:hypothetical protein